MDDDKLFRTETDFKKSASLGRRKFDRMSMMPMSVTSSPDKGTRKGRTLSVDTGMTALVTRFYEEKLAQAKNTANAELQSFITEVVKGISTATLAGAAPADLDILERLKGHAQQLFIADAVTLVGGRLKPILSDIMKVKDAHRAAAEPMTQKFINKLLLIISSFSRLLGYLDIANTEINSFVTDAADEFRRIHEEFKKEGATTLTPDKKKDAPQAEQVCRICEKLIPGERFNAHSEKCLQLKDLEAKCIQINERLLVELEGVGKELQVDVQDRRATRRMTFIPGFSDEELVEDYISKVFSILSEKEFKEYRQLLRDFNDPDKNVKIDDVVERVKAMFKDDDKFLVLKGFIGFLPANVQMRHCMEIMEKIWRREDAEMKAREDLWVKMQASVKNIVALRPQDIDSFERCSKRLRQFQQLRSLFMTKSCEGALKAHVKALDSLILEKFNILQEVFSFGVAANVLDLSELGADFNKKSVKDEKSGVSISDFEIIKPISRGSFGSVLLAKKKATGDVYAIKVLRKDGISSKNQLAHIRNERNILAFADCDFVVKMYYSFQSEKNLYMVMEFLNGGDCFSLIREITYFDEELARQFVAETVLALKYLHSIGVVHRDMKPDNMLISNQGHIKLTDFGLSRMGMLDRQEDNADWRLKKAFMGTEEVEEGEGGAVGTPDYIAPEVFLGTGCGPAVDWWAVGCIAYEFLVGITPFYGDTMEEIFENILAHNVLWPDDQDISEEAMDFVHKLLAFDEADRLGTVSADDVMNHPWFEGIDWDTLMQQESLFVPKCADLTDTSYFDARQEYFPTSEIQEELDDTKSTTTAQRFRGFSFINVDQLARTNTSLNS